MEGALHGLSFLFPNLNAPKAKPVCHLTFIISLKLLADFFLSDVNL